MSRMTAVDIDAKIPNNVDLAGDRRLQRALESWQPRFIEWWQDARPGRLPGQGRVPAHGDRPSARRAGPTSATSKMPDYRWGIFLAEPEPDRTIAFGDHLGEPAWQEVPGEYRADLRRLLVVQGDTEPASVEQQRALCLTAPSLYDLRNLFQVNVEEGRHLWAMVYLLHRYFGRDGRDEADEMLERHSGDADHPRILGAFNEPTPGLAVVLLLHLLHRPRRQVPARLAARERLRPAVADVRLHAEGGGAPHVRRRHRHRPRRAAHGRADEGARHRRRPRRSAGSTWPRCSATSTSTTACRSTCSAPRRRPTPPTTSPPG